MIINNTRDKLLPCKLIIRGAAPEPPGFNALVSPKGIKKQGGAYCHPTPPFYRNLAGAQVASQHCPILLPGKSH